MAILRSCMGVVAGDSLLYPFWHLATGLPFWYILASSSSGVAASGTTLGDTGYSAAPPFDVGGAALVGYHIRGQLASPPPFMPGVPRIDENLSKIE